jgi:3-phenylpropionate/trans-cinnamate dioxygenase ferredoxin subunit
MPKKFFKVYDFAEHGNEPQTINSVRTIDIEGKRICLVRLSDSYYAIDDTCPHAGARLGLGKCDENGMVVCPIHRYKYDAKTGRGLPQQGDFVNTYVTETRTDGVYVAFDKKWWQIF